jgi:hypothetical protein
MIVCGGLVNLPDGQKSMLDLYKEYVSNLFIATVPLILMLDKVRTSALVWVHRGMFDSGVTLFVLFGLGSETCRRKCGHRRSVREQLPPTFLYLGKALFSRSHTTKSSRSDNQFKVRVGP